MFPVKVHPNAVTLIFGEGTHPWITPLIKFRSRSKYSHVAYVDPLSGLIIEAAGGIGVRVVTHTEFITKYPKWHTATMFVPCAQYTRQFMVNQIGKPYDHPAVFGYLFAQNWDREDAWTCTEIIAAASGMHRRRTFARISPHDLFSITRPSQFKFNFYPETLVLTKEDRLHSDPTKGNETEINSVRLKLHLWAHEYGWRTNLKRPTLKPIEYPA